MAEPLEELQPGSGVEPVSLVEAGGDRLRQALEPRAWERLRRAGAELARLLVGKRLWHVNSTAKGGGVAEVLNWFLPLLASAGVDVRWVVLTAPPEFFEVTKRIHHLLHESRRPLGEADRSLYEGCLAGAAEELCTAVQPGDAVVVHDPQPAGLIPALAARGAHVVWRCHVGTDTPGPSVREARRFLLPYVQAASRVVFSRAAFAWEELADAKAKVIQPAIYPLAPKNEPLDQHEVRRILEGLGLGAEAAAPLVTQVSRWDPLKDPLGVMKGFAEHVPATTGAHLVLAGPAVSAVSDDPEGKEVLDAVQAAWRSLPANLQDRVHVVSLPMEDADANARMVNALQRASAVVVQKSLREGFGLTVAEALWKSRPVVASRVGGIQEQIVDGETGLLLDDPNDLAAFGGAVTRLLHEPGLGDRLGRAGRAKVEAAFLPDTYLDRWREVLREALEAG